MFARSYLPPARLEFVIMTDTHYMLDPGAQAVEFENRRLQSARAEVALAQVTALQTPFVVHLGDLVQTFPGRPDFVQAVDEAQSQINSFNLDIRLAPGNHDVGDKPDPTMPTDWATPEALAAHHARFSQSWFSWDWQELHFVVLNSQIMNTSLPEAQAQADWAEADLTAHAGQRQFVFLHLPPYLYSPQEPSLGHYDNLGQPARDWFLDLVQQTGVELFCAAHVHFAFYDWLPHTESSSTQEEQGNRGVRYFVIPSPAFTRPGFSELFSGPPPDQQGRNDTPKLGFYLARVHEHGTRLHFLRTGGATELASTTGLQLLTRHPLDLPHSALGVNLRHPLANVTDVPVAWPSVIRQRVRNDYPLLLAQEMGVRHLRFPVEELFDHVQRARLALAQAEGSQLTGTMLWPSDRPLGEIAAHARDLLDTLEVQWAPTGDGNLLPAPDCLEWLGQLKATVMTLAFAPLYPHYTVAGKQHNRTRVGYDTADFGVMLAAVGALQDQGLPRLRALCAAPHVEALAAWLCALADTPLPGALAGVDWLISLTGEDDTAQAASAAQTLFMLAVLPGARAFFDPWLDLDRTMDVMHGLLDRSCNPRPAFHALKTLNTVLFSADSPLVWRESASIAGGYILCAVRGEERLWLLTPPTSQDIWTIAFDALPGRSSARSLQRYDLIAGTVTSVEEETITIVDREIVLLEEGN